jgi:hypothetical protein
MDKAKILLVIGSLAGLVGLTALFVFGFFGQNEYVKKDENGIAYKEGEDSIDLFPSRSQERIQEVEGKDTEFEQAEQVDVNSCKDYYCFEKHYRKVVVEDTIANAFVDLKVRYDQSVLVRSLCHPLTHVIGRAAAQKYSNVGEAYIKGDHFCWSGYYHGVMEGILYETTPEKLPDTINAICNNIPGKAVYSFDYYNCVHGLGHGVMYITDNELFDALVLCDHLEGSWEQESCYGGAFMENVIVDFENHFTKYLKPDEPLYPCTAVPEKNKHACYLMQTSYVLKQNGYNFVDAFAQCSAVEDRHQDTCYQSVGRDASGSTVSDIARTKAYCLLGKNERQQTGCVVGAVKDFISYFHSDTQAKQFCNSFLVEDKTLTDICLFIAGDYYESFTSSSSA